MGYYMAKKEKQKEKETRQDKEKPRGTIRMERLGDLPMAAISFGTMDWNETGNWRYLRPVYKTKTAPCIVGCPVEENIPRYLLKSSQGDHEEAWRMLVRDNPFPAVCGRLCDSPCEGVCLRRSFDETVGVRDLERFLGDLAIGRFTIGPPKVVREDRVAVIGAGPTGLSCAYFLGSYGYRVTLFEGREALGGTLRSQVPPSMLPSRILDGEIANVLSIGIEVRTGTRFDDSRTLEEMARDYRAVYLATGTPGDGLPAGRERERFDVVRAFSSGSAFLEGWIDLREGRIRVDNDGRTSREVIFAGGGAVVEGALNIAEAISWGKRGAKAIDGFIKGMSAGRATKERELVTLENLNLDHFRKEARVLPGVRVSQEGDIEERVQTFDEKTAVAEASRCFNCGICVFCDNCLIFCPDVAVEKVARGYRIDYYHCKGCGICVNECPRDAMSMESELKWRK